MYVLHGSCLELRLFRNTIQPPGDSTSGDIMERYVIIIIGIRSTLLLD